MTNAPVRQAHPGPDRRGAGATTVRSENQDLYAERTVVFAGTVISRRRSGGKPGDCGVGGLAAEFGFDALSAGWYRASRLPW